MSTIYALATPPGRSGIAVVRVSGPEAFAAAEALAGPLPPARCAGLRRLKDEAGSVLDEALVLTFPEGASFTGEPTVEIQCHGSPAVVDALLDSLSRKPGLSPAEPGEFTRRALMHGRMDLAQVEGLADLLAAETALQRERAWDVYDGGISSTIEDWRSRLVGALALLEAVIDFSDDAEADGVPGMVADTAKDVVGEIERELDGITTAERIRDGFEVAIVGRPNTGKSTLLNYIAGRDVAITSSAPGTTRDVLEVRLDLRGIPIVLLDTAGLRASEDELERIGIERARMRLERADLRVILVDHECMEPIIAPSGEDIVLTAKGDLHEAGRSVSGMTGAGVDQLLEEIERRCYQRVANGGRFSRHRHRVALQEAIRALRSAIEAAGPEEIIAELLWRAVGSLGRVTGHVDVEEVLDEVFSEFCIGK